jgi:hypothetical protein
VTSDSQAEAASLPVADRADAASLPVADRVEAASLPVGGGTGAVVFAKVAARAGDLVRGDYH